MELGGGQSRLPTFCKCGCLEQGSCTAFLASRAACPLAEMCSNVTTTSLHACWFGSVLRISWTVPQAEAPDLTWHCRASPPERLGKERMACWITRWSLLVQERNGTGSAHLCPRVTDSIHGSAGLGCEYCPMASCGKATLMIWRCRKVVAVVRHMEVGVVIVEAALSGNGIVCGG